MVKQSVPSPDVDALLGGARRRPPGGTCTVGRALGSVAPDVRSKLQAALDDRDGYSCTPLAAAISKVAGLTVGRGAVERHRRGDCNCG